MAEEGSDRLQAHATVDGLGGQGVTQLVRVDVADAGGGGDSGDPALHGVAVERALLAREEPAVGMGFVGPSIGVEQLDEMGVEGDVAVVVELAEGDPQPGGVADDGDGVGLEVAQLADAHAGAGQQLDGHPPREPGLGGQGPHELGEAGVVEEAGQWLVPLGDVAEEDGHPRRGVLPSPLGDPQEEGAQLAHPPAERRRLERAGDAGLAALPQLERLDVGPLDVGHAAQRRVMVDEETGEHPEVGLDGPDRRWPHGHRHLGHVGQHGGCQLGRCGMNSLPLGRYIGSLAMRVGELDPGAHRVAHRAWASMASAALRYSAASQSSARCR
jgi:hypothetical protein